MIFIKFKRNLLLLIFIFTVSIIIKNPLLMAQANVDNVRIMPPNNPIKQNYEIEELKLIVDIRGQAATVTYTQTIYNPDNTNLEVEYLLPLPAYGKVSALNLKADHQILEGAIYNKDEAWKIYRDIVAKAQDPAILQYANQGLLQANIFPIPPKSKRSLEVQFEILLNKQDGRINLNFPIAGPMTVGRIIKQQNIQINLKAEEEIKNIYSPYKIEIKRQKDNKGATISLENKNSNALDNFNLYYQVEKKALSAFLLSHKPRANEDGFFMLLAEPELTVTGPSPSKNIVFALDTSGSMSAENKFPQSLEAIKYILNSLALGDKFNLVTYSSKATSWQNELVDINAENKKQALQYINNLRASGTTNIDEALKLSFGFLEKGNNPNYVLFLTDGEPTTGETNELPLAKIAQNVNKDNLARLFSFGVGTGVNARLLDRLSGENGGTSVFVNPDEDINKTISLFFETMGTPALTEPKFNTESNFKTNRLSPAKLPDMFVGGQLILVGRYPQGGSTEIILTGALEGKKQEFKYLVNFSETSNPDGDFISRIWAQRRIGEIIDQIDMEAKSEPNGELLDELIQLSKEYGILTPYTSFLALEETNIQDQNTLRRQTSQNLSAMEETVGSSANTQRQTKASFKASKTTPSSAISKKETMIEMEQMAALDQTVTKSTSKNLLPPQQLGSKTFFNKNKQLQEATLTEKELKKEPIIIQQLSEEYFQLAQTLNPKEMSWLTQDIAVVFSHNDKIYKIEPINKL